MDINVSIGNPDDDSAVSVSICDDQGYNPTAARDALDHLAATALVVYRDLHPAPAAT